MKLSMLMTHFYSYALIVYSICTTCSSIDHRRDRAMSDSLKRVLDDLNKFSKVQMSENWKQPNLAKIAYYIPIYKTEERRGIQLISRIVVPHNVHFVHLAKDVTLQQPVVAGLQYLNKSSKSIYLLESQIVNYRGISTVDTELTAMSKALKLDESWDFFITLSALDYPLMTQQNIAKLLGELNLLQKKVVSFMEFKNFGCDLIKDRILRFYRDPATQGSFLLHNPSSVESDFTVKLDNNVIQIFKSNVWKLFSRDLIKYLIISQDGYARRLLLFFSQTQFSVEHFFPTTICNSPNLDKNLIRNGTITFKNFDNINWGERFKKNYFSPNQITERLLKQALTQGAFFASSFSASAESVQVKELIDKMLSGQEIQIDGQKFTKEKFYETTKSTLLKQMEENICQVQQQLSCN